MIHTAELIWQNIIDAGANRIDNFAELLNLQPGASEPEFRRLEETLGVTLPEEFKSFYSVYNGQIWNSDVEPAIRNLLLHQLQKLLIIGHFFRRNSTRMMTLNERLARN